MQALEQPTLASELRALAWAAVVVPVCAAYARFACRHLRPGFPRLAALFPTFPVFIYMPWMFNSLHLRLLSTFFHTWLAVNKLVLLAFDIGPLHPSFPFLPFFLCTGLPIKLRADGPRPTTKHQFPPWAEVQQTFLVPCARSFLFISCLGLLYPRIGWLPVYLVHFLYCIHVFLTLDLVFSAAGLSAAAALGSSMDMGRRFRTPIAVESINGFWGRQWNLTAVDLLRVSLYQPVRARWGRDAGVLAAFLFSGFLHELLYWYLTLRRPTGEMLLFFMLHGGLHIAERWARVAVLCRPPKLAAYFLMTSFMLVTISELFFGPFMRAGTDVRLIQESMAALEFVKHLLRPIGALSS